MNGFEAPWRPTYELYSISTWIFCGLATTYAAIYQGLPQGPYFYLIVVTLLFVFINGVDAWANLRRRIALGGKGIAFINDEQLFLKVKESPKEMWMGWGFDWGNEHTQRLYDIKRGDPAKYYAPKWMLHLTQSVTKQPIGSITPAYVGSPWLHGLDPDEFDLRVSVDNFIGNTLILGTTRCGKTRMLDIVAAQAIEMGFTVILLDPKGDRELENSMFEAAKRSGRARDFVRIHLGFPQSSIRIDLLKNFTNPSDLATRISSLMPGDGGASSSFRDFAWGVINAIVLGMLYMDEKPSLLSIRSYAKTGINDLLLRVLLRYMDKQLAPGWENEAAEYALAMPRAKGKSTDTGEILVRQSLGLLVAYYADILKGRGHNCECIEALSSIFKHDAAHYSKVISNLLPILDMLTTGELASLLSPDASNIEDPRPLTDNQALIRSKAIVYFGLDSLANKSVATAVGSMYLSDMTSVAAGIYNYEPERGKKEKIFLIVDESAEVINEPYISMLNKSAGAGFVNIAAAQTVPDFSARLGSIDKARQMLGNFNNLFAMRVKDGDTQEFIVETFGEVFISTKQVTFASTSNTKEAVTEFSGSVNERVSETLSAQIPPDVLGEIPNWQYIAAVAGGRIIKGRLPIIQHSKEAP